MMESLVPRVHPILPGVPSKGAQWFAKGCLIVALGLFGASCDRSESATSAPVNDDLAARMVTGSVRVDAWKNGAIPYAFGTEINATLRGEIRSAMNDWEAGSEGRVRFSEVAASYPEAKLTISMAATNEAFGGQVYAYVTGKPSAGMSMVLANFPFASVQPRDPRPNILGLPTGGTYEILLHEVGHVLGLAHEQQNPGVRTSTTPIVTGNRSDCPVDLYTSWETPSGTLFNSERSVVVPQDEFNATTVDLNSVMWSEGYNCNSQSSVRFYDVYGKAVGSQFNGPSPGDFEAVKAIYTLPSVARLWDVNAVINLEFAPMTGTTKTAMENYASSNLQVVASRWLGSLDPRTGAITGRSPLVNIVNRSSAPGPGSVLRFSVDPNLFDPVPWRVSCNSETKTTYCEVRLDSRMFKNTYSQPINQEIMILNVLQAAFGSALGLSSKSIQSAVYENNAWSANWIFPTVRDIEALRARYGTFGEGTLPLIEVRNNLGAGYLYTKYVHGWDEVEKLPKGVISRVSVLGSVLRGGSSLSQTVPNISMSLGRAISQYTVGYEMVWGTQTLAQAVQALPAGKCPTAAVQSAQSVQAIAGSTKLPMLARQSSATFPDALKASWVASSGLWILSSSPTYAPCQVDLGFYRAR